MNPQEFNSLTPEDLRSSGLLKWVEYPQSVGAWVAEMDYGTAPAVRQSVVEAAQACRFGYLSSQETTALAEATADFYQRQYGWDFDASSVYAATDVLTILRIFLEHFLDPGAPVIVPTPAYMPFTSLPEEYGHPVIEVPMLQDEGRYLLDLKAIEAAYPTGITAGVILCNPHNPTGQVASRRELLALSEVVDRCGGIVFCDEIHAPLTYRGQRHIPYASLNEVTASHTITAASAAKAWNIPGLKCAQAILSNPRHLSQWREQDLSGHAQPSTLGAIANATAYRDGEEWLAQVLEYLQGNRDSLVWAIRKGLGPHRCTTPDATFLAWIDVRGFGLGDDPAAELRDRAGIALTNGSACGRAGEGFIRFNFAMPRPILLDAADRLINALREG